MERETLMTNHEAVRSFLAESAIAVVGVSRNGKGFGNFACRELRARGYHVYPIHPVATTIGDTHCYKQIADVPERINAVLVVVSPTAAVDVVRDAAAVGVRRVWLQQGAETAEVVDQCRQLGSRSLQASASSCTPSPPASIVSTGGFTTSFRVPQVPQVPKGACPLGTVGT
jgi:predicted CoA-binding protein